MHVGTVDIRERGPTLESPMSGDYEEFFTSEYGLVVAFLCKTGFDFHVADDATQDAMIRAYHSWRMIATNPRGWVRTTAYRIAIKKATRSRSELPRLIALGYGQTTCDGTEHHRQLEQQDELLRALSLLPDRQRLVMAWHLDGFTDDEISQATGMKATTVRSNLRHAREKLRESLGISR